MGGWDGAQMNSRVIKVAATAAVSRLYGLAIC
jgi:hypothetical protein